MKTRNLQGFLGFLLTEFGQLLLSLTMHHDFFSQGRTIEPITEKTVRGSRGEAGGEVSGGEWNGGEGRGGEGAPSSTYIY